MPPIIKFKEEKNMKTFDKSPIDVANNVFKGVNGAAEEATNLLGYASVKYPDDTELLHSLTEHKDVLMNTWGWAHESVNDQAPDEDVVNV